jgi:hypothetical protein
MRQLSVLAAICGFCFLSPVCLAEDAPSRIKDAKEVWDSSNKVAGTVGSVVQGVKSFNELLESYQALTDTDKGVTPDYNPHGGPQVPSSCVDADNDACAGCYAAAYEKLNKVRRNLEQLRAIRGATEDYYKAALAFGDTTSGIHGITGLAWQAERRKIEASIKKFQTSYKTKYRQLIDTLHDALQEVSQCEAEHFGERDWYDRYGYMYQTFMEDRYRW